jgi:taurine dioxygenase
MRLRFTEPLGVIVTDLSLADAGLAVTSDLRGLLARHGVLVMPGQDIDDATFVAFLQRFGALAFTAGETPVAGCPDLNLISNVGRSTPPRSVFHVDTSYVRQPPAYTALRAVTVPAQGGETLFTNQYRAFETLPLPLHDRLAGRTIRHQVTGLHLGAGDETAAEHPVFRPHPVSGQTSLYVSTPERCVAISGLADAEARATIEFLYAHSAAPGNTFRHAWSPGDVVMWDNGCVLHRADHSGVSGDRVMHRGMVAGYAGAAP